MTVSLTDTKTKKSVATSNPFSTPDKGIENDVRYPPPLSRTRHRINVPETVATSTNENERNKQLANTMKLRVATASVKRSAADVNLTRYS